MIVRKQRVEHRYALVQERVPPAGVRDADLFGCSGRIRGHCPEAGRGVHAAVPA